MGQKYFFASENQPLVNLTVLIGRDRILSMGEFKKNYRVCEVERAMPAENL
jgi:hypothetical protein